MKNKWYLFLFPFYTVAFLFSQDSKAQAINVSNIHYRLIDERIEVFFDLPQSLKDSVIIELFFYKRSDSSFVYQPLYTNGDIGKGMFAGPSNKIIWNIKGEPAFVFTGSGFYFKVSAVKITHSKKKIPLTDAFIIKSLNNYIRNNQLEIPKAYYCFDSLASESANYSDSINLEMLTVLKRNNFIRCISNNEYKVYIILTSLGKKYLLSETDSFYTFSISSNQYTVNSRLQGKSPSIVINNFFHLNDLGCIFFPDSSLNVAIKSSTYLVKFKLVGEEYILDQSFNSYLFEPSKISTREPNTPIIFNFDVFNKLVEM